MAILNRYDPSSALSYLNTEGSIPGPPPELSEVLSAGLVLSTEPAREPSTQPSNPWLTFFASTWASVQTQG